MDLRCHSCSHAIGSIADGMELVAIFKPKVAGTLNRARNDEKRLRCRHCGWMNVFHPQRVGSYRDIEFKELSGCAP